MSLINSLYHLDVFAARGSEGFGITQLHALKTRRKHFQY